MREFKLFACGAGFILLGVLLWRIWDYLPYVSWACVGIGGVFLLIGVVRFSLPAVEKVVDIHEKRIDILRVQSEVDMQYRILDYAIQSGAQLEMHGAKVTHALRTVVSEVAEQKQIAAPQQPVIVQPTMDEMYSAVKYNALEVAFGKNAKTGETIVQGIIPGVHFKLVGGSGFGKSCLAAALLDVATRRNDPDHLRIALLDLEHKTSRLFEHMPHVMNVTVGKRTISMVATDADEVARHLGWLRKELDRRASGSFATPLLLIYVEEMLSLQYEVDSALKEQMLADLAILALRGRKYGMFLLACTQTDYSTKELREAQKQFRTRSGFAVDPTAARAAGFVNNDLIKYNYQFAQPGRFVLEKPGFSELVLAPLYDVEQKLEELSNPSRLYVPNSYSGSQWVEGDSFVVPDHFPQMPGNHAGKQQEVDTEKISLVRDLVRKHKSQNEIISKAFPGMRNVDAVAEYRRYLALLVESEAL